MNWLSSKITWVGSGKFRTTTDRAVKRFVEESYDDAIAKTLALAVAHACYPSACYGDGGNMDAMLKKIGGLASTPCDPKTALMFTGQWEKRSIASDELFERVWGFTIDAFIVALVKKARV